MLLTLNVRVIYDVNIILNLTIKENDKRVRIKADMKASV